MRTVPSAVLGPVWLRFSLRLCSVLVVGFTFALVHPCAAQDGSTSLQALIEDATGGRIVSSAIVITDSSRGFRLEAKTDTQVSFTFGMLPPGRYDFTASAPLMASRTSR